MVNDAFDHDLDVDASQQIEVSEDRLYKLAEIGQTEGGLSLFRAAVLESLHMTEAAMKQDGLSGVGTGLNAPAKLLGGLHRAALLILAARLSLGKTAMATTLASKVATAAGSGTGAEGHPVQEGPPVPCLSVGMS